jgi:nitronate monooxygenase
VSKHLGNRETARQLLAKTRLPVMGAPMFIGSSAALVIAQCSSGVIGAIPALNSRSSQQLDETLFEIEEALATHDAAHPEAPAAPYGLNLVAHASNQRLEADLAVLLAHKVPLAVIALGAPADLVKAIHGYGGLIFNDVISTKHARKCAEAGVDGLIAVCAGAGGHTGNVSPFALVQEIRAFWDGPLALSGCIANGRGILAAQAMGADFAYIGSAFLATPEANTPAGFKQMIVDCAAQDVMVTNCFTGVNATFLRPSIEAQGLDPAKLARPEGAKIDISNGGANSKAWRDIWSAGQGIGAIRQSEPAAAYISRLAAEYEAAKIEMRQLTC